MLSILFYFIYFRRWGNRYLGIRRRESGHLDIHFLDENT